MADFTNDELATFFSNANNNVAMINKLAAESSLTDAQKARIERNVLHLERMKTIKTVNDETGQDTDTSIWTTEDFSQIDTAIALGKTKY